MRTINSLCSRLDIDNIIEYTPELTITDNKTWSNIFNLKLMLNYQKEHGIVDYLPFPYALVSSHPIEVESSLVVIGDASDELRSFLINEFKIITYYLATNLTTKQCLTIFNESSFVIILTNKIRRSILCTLLICTRPFIIVGTETCPFIKHIIEIANIE